MKNTEKTFPIAVMVVAVVLMTFSSGNAQAPSPQPDCFSALLNLSDCLTFVEERSNKTSPEKGCCPELAGLVDSTPVCLCQLLANSNSFGVQINRTKALTLPNVCRVQTPPFSLCSLVGAPVSGPTASVGPSSPVSGMSPSPSDSEGGATASGTPSTMAPGTPAAPSRGTSSFKISKLAFLAGLSGAVALIF